MYDSSGLEFFRTTTGIQLDQTSLMNQGSYYHFNHLRSYINIIQFRLVLEGKAGKERLKSPRSEFLEKFLANNFALSDAEGHILGSLNRGGITDLPFVENTMSNLPKVARVKIL